jgi:hypothetical protein
MAPPRPTPRAGFFEMQHKERMLAMEKGIPLPELAPSETHAAPGPTA